MSSPPPADAWNRTASPSREAGSNASSGRDRPAGEAVSPSPDEDDRGPWGRSWAWWAEVSALLPPPARRGRRADTDLTAVVAAILDRDRHRYPWRRLPKQFPPWQTVYAYSVRWLKDGTLRQIKALARADDEANGPPPDRPSPGSPPAPDKPR
ncbi:MAG: transposase [Planctomycetota bacterium]